MKKTKVAIRFNLFLFFITIVLIFAANFAAYMIDTQNNPDYYIALWENDGNLSDISRQTKLNNPTAKSERQGADYLANVRFVGDNDTLTEYLSSQDGTGDHPVIYYYIYAPEAEVKAPDAPIGATVYICAKRPVSGDNSSIDKDNSELLKIANENDYHFVDINLPLKGPDGKLRNEYTDENGNINENGCCAALEWILTHIA